MPGSGSGPRAAFGLAQGVTIDEAAKIVMPLTPRLLVAVGPASRSAQPTDAEVDSYNAIQVRQAREYVLHRPSADFAASIVACRT